jgi:hypothetical protein
VPAILVKRPVFLTFVHILVSVVHGVWEKSEKLLLYLHEHQWICPACITTMDQPDGQINSLMPSAVKYLFIGAPRHFRKGAGQDAN